MSAIGSAQLPRASGQRVHGREERECIYDRENIQNQTSVQSATSEYDLVQEGQAGRSLLLAAVGCTQDARDSH